MALARVSQRDIARRAKVHFTTVSLALRNSPSLPEATRLRIQTLAKGMGYRPDPMLCALQSYRKNAKSPRFQGIIAWINRHPIPAQLYTGKFVQRYLSAATQRCEELGYQLEEFNLAKMDTLQLSKVFRARNIQGLLLPPQPLNPTPFVLDWENYSAVTFGYSLSRPRLHLFSNAQYSSARKGVRILRKHGYHRIGFVITQISDERTDRNFSAGYLADQRSDKPSDRIPMLIDDGREMAKQQRSFERWYKAHRPDAILAHHEKILPFMEEAGIAYSECGLALLALDFASEGKFAGIYQNDFLIGSTAVDFVVGMIQRNERGVPETPLRILVEGKWVEGETLPIRCANMDLGDESWQHLSAELAK